MSDDNSINPFSRGRFQANNEMIDLRKVSSQIISNKYFFIGALIVALAAAYVYNSYTIPVYRVSATLLIEQDKKANVTGNDQLLEGFGLMPGLRNLDNQIMVLSSRTLVSRTLERLNFETEYYYRGLIKKRSFYPAVPIAIITDSDTKIPENVEFGLKYLNSNMFRLDAESDGSFEIHTKASFGEKIVFPGGSFRIERNEGVWGQKDSRRKLFFMIHSHRNLVEDYIKRLKIEPVSKKGTIVRVSLEGTNKIEDLAFLNEFTRIFLNISLDKKNAEALRTIQFIDAQLVGISDSLVLTESKLQQFRTRNRVMNLSAQGQVIIDQAVNLENEKARLSMEAKYFDYLTEYLEKDEVNEVPIAPATMGIVDPGLTKLVADLAELQGRLFSKSLGEKNPLQSQLTQRIQNTKEALKETLKGMKGANSLALQENQEQLIAINTQASVLPKTERELLGFERKYKLNDELFTFLLEKRAVAQMQKASNVPDNEMIDYPEYDNLPVKPNKPLIYLFALVTGIGFPFMWVFMAGVFNIRIKDPEEIKKITDIPITGHLPHTNAKSNKLVLDDPDSLTTEAFRLLRSRMKFFTKEISSPVILVTSTIPKEGKTFTAINLASAYSLLGKKTILVGFDLRQPKIFSDFGLENERGVSTWLIGKDKLENIINKTSYQNLHIITSGPVPPNPSELTTLDKTAELIAVLKTKYECIVIDSSPVGIVSDTFHLATIADVCLMVVRQNLTIKEMLTETLQDLKNSKVKSLNLVINDIVANNKPYRYGEIYGNSYIKKKSREGNKEKRSFYTVFFRDHLNF